MASIKCRYYNILSTLFIFLNCRFIISIKLKTSNQPTTYMKVPTLYLQKNRPIVIFILNYYMIIFFSCQLPKYILNVDCAGLIIWVQKNIDSAVLAYTLPTYIHTSTSIFFFFLTHWSCARHNNTILY